MARILLYHRIALPGRDPWALAVSPDRFDAHMAVIAKHWRPMALLDLADAAAAGEPPEDAVAVTFDDGYASTLTEALPRFDRHGVPVTCFLVGGFLTPELEPWWDELEHLVFGPDDAGRPRFEDDQGWLAWEEPRSERQARYVGLWTAYRSMSQAERLTALDALRAESGRVSVARPTHRLLTVGEAAALARSPLVEVGAHTMTHPRLTDLPLAAQRREIENSRVVLRELLGRPIRSFAYPFGGVADYAADTVAAVRRAGFDCACANVDGVVGPDTDPFQFPRRFVRDLDGDAFARWLETT